MLETKLVRGEVGFSLPWSMWLVNLEQVAVKWR